MDTAVSAHGHTNERSADAAPLTLESLLDKSADELEALYRNARVPQLADVSGHLRGRMLAVPALGALNALPRALARLEHFPWRGKSFRPQSETRGEGDNRVIVDAWHWYRFTTFVGRSRAGDFDAVQLDYDHPHNPFFIRAIKDEIREVAPGLYLGQAYLQTRGTPRLALYFALARP